MVKESKVKSIVAILFVIVLFWGFVRNGSYSEINKIADYLKQEDFGSQESILISSLENDYASELVNRKALINLNGSLAKKLKMQGFYSDMGMYITDDNYIVSASEYTTTDYEVEQTVAFRDFLETNGIKLLYVNEPTKYMDDSLFREEFGVETYSNRNMDLFLSRIGEAGVNYIDLRDNIRKDNLNVFDLFYRTDHHWTTNAGLWASQIIAQGLNEFCEYNIDTSIYDIENYNVTEWKACWLGEQGRKVAETYVGLDDYTEIKPSFETSYLFKNGDGTTWSGTFDDFVNEEVYNTENDVYENDSWHYSYAQMNCINNNVNDGKVLVLGDSYEQVTVPFLSLGVHEADSLILRNCDDSFSLKNYIIENGYDTVVICYAQFMLGAHDVTTSANYRMFDFEN